MKKKLLRNASLVALSAVMVCGTAFGLAGCKDDANLITASMFCGADDRQINVDACNAWAEEYTKKLIEDGVWEEGHAPIEVELTTTSDSAAYFQTLLRQISSNSQPDIFYVSPKYVKAFSSLGRVLDLSDYLKTEEDVALTSDIWDDSFAFYAYSTDENYVRGERITFDSDSNEYVGTNSGAAVGIYGLPKDFSNFGLSYNALFFTDEIRTALTTLTTADRTGIKGARYSAAGITYQGEDGVVVDENGDNAPLINIGVPTTYYPYNFYRFGSYQEALAAGDPMATMCEHYTDRNGYTVTIPGFPGDTFEEAKKWWPDGANMNVTLPEEYVNPDANYDASQGYITYTYAEYSALTWALTYYFNTYDWEGKGVGGITTADGTRNNIYGNDQYDDVLYVLPWLAGNDAAYSNEESTSVINGDDRYATGTDTYTLNRVGIDGKDRPVEIQYGINSDKYMETIGAFHSYGADWNGNSNNIGDTTDTKNSGWEMFIAGNLIFYGMGTWNGIETNKTNRSILQTSLMPEPVSEDYALYSEIKTEDNEIEEYSYNDVGRKSEFTAQEIFENQLVRQDKWAARMDSVGYGVSSTVLEEEEWKVEACVDLVKKLTIDPAMQATLTYSGSQLPNFKSMCVDFMNKEGDYFGQMLTPDDGEKFDSAYQLALSLSAAGTAEASGSTKTIGQWMTENGGGQPYDPQFENTTLNSVNSIAYAMKVLYLTGYSEKDRDLSLRMQFGMNFVRDAAMYTFTNEWLTCLDARGKLGVMAYRQQGVSDHMRDIIDAMITSDRVQDSLNGVKDATVVDGERYGTSKWWCLYRIDESQRLLDDAIKEENRLLGIR